jgi:hypothetical protein
MHDYVFNGVGHGPVGAAFNVVNKFTGRFDPGLLRPFIETDPNSPDRGRRCAVIQEGWTTNKEGDRVPVLKKRTVDYLEAHGVYSPVFNATTLFRDDWIQIDRAVQKATRQPLTAWNDLRAANTKGGFDAWAKLTYEYYAMSDAGRGRQGHGRDKPRARRHAARPHPVGAPAGHARRLLLPPAPDRQQPGRRDGTRHDDDRAEHPPHLGDGREDPDRDRDRRDVRRPDDRPVPADRHEHGVRLHELHVPGHEDRPDDPDGN